MPALRAATTRVLLYVSRLSVRCRTPLSLSTLACTQAYHEHSLTYYVSHGKRTLYRVFTAFERNAFLRSPDDRVGSAHYLSINCRHCTTVVGTAHGSHAHDLDVTGGHVYICPAMTNISTVPYQGHTNKPYFDSWATNIGIKCIYKR